MVNLGGFNANDHEPSDFSVLPESDYPAIIAASEMKVNSKGTGKYLEIEYQVIDGEYRGRKLWSRHNLEHTNELTVKIAKGELSAICRAVGVLTPKDSVELHNLPLIVRVAVKKRQDNNEDTNIIKKWMPVDKGDTAPQKQEPKKQAEPKTEGAKLQKAFDNAKAADTAGDSAPPWKK